MNLRTIIALITASSVAACGTNAVPKDGKLKGSACTAARQSYDDYRIVTECERLTAEQTFRGMWYVGFELSGFSNVDNENPKRPVDLDTLDRLIVPAKIDAAVHGTDGDPPSAYRVQFEGRLSLLRTPETRMIVMDKIITIQKLPFEPRFAVPPPSGTR